MCKIILKFGSALTHSEMEDHRERCEKGAGVMGWNETEKGLFSYREMSHSTMWKSYVRDSQSSSPFWLFHSRMPSAGDVNMRNVQPFHGKETIGFCHNGTIPKADLFKSLAPLGEYLDGTESDSYLLFRVLKRCHPRTVQTILENYNDNFIYVNVHSQTILIVGRFEISRKNDSLFMARNVWSELRSTLLCTFTGKIKFWKKEKPYTPTTYFSTTRRLEDVGGTPRMNSPREDKELEKFLDNTASAELQEDFDHLEGIGLDPKDS